MNTKIKKYGIIDVARNKAKAYFMIIQNFFFSSVIIYTIYYNVAEKGEYLAFLFLPIIYIGFVQIIEAFRKISSDKPEFTLLNDKLLVYDNPDYSEIYYSDMVKCRIGGNRFVDVLIIELNKNKDFPHLKTIRKNKKQTIRLTLRYVKLNSRTLNRILNYKIGKNNNRSALNKLSD